MPFFNGTFSQDCGGLQLKRWEESYRIPYKVHNMYSKNGEEKTADCIFALFHKYQTLCECNCDTAQYSQKSEKTIRNKNKKQKKIFLLKKTICLKN